MKGTYFELYIKTCFSENYAAVVTKTHWAIKKEEIVNMTNFVLFTLL